MYDVCKIKVSNVTANSNRLQRYNACLIVGRGAEPETRQVRFHDVLLDNGRLFLGTRHRRRPTRLALLTRHVVERTAVQAGRTPTALPRAFAVTAYGKPAAIV